MREVAYFHTDHFEPWRLVPGRPQEMAFSVGDVEAYLARTERLEFARRASLFYKANVNFQVSADRALFRADPSDLLGFVPRDNSERKIGADILRPIVEGSGHEVQVHVHHENYTYNDTSRDSDTHAYLQTARGRSFDNARLELGLRLGLEVFREDAGLDLKHWFFVHGHWALNAADPHECTIVREVEILLRNGCLGDFTQPAGRPHVDSRIDVPYLAQPVPLAKGYDTPEARPVPAAGAADLAASRFFIWASKTSHELCSIDTYSAFVQRRLRTPEVTALQHARGAPVINGVLYLKTHCHSLSPSYWKPDGRPLPHLDEGVKAELGALFDGAQRAGAAVRFINASEAYAEIIGGPPGEARDLVTDCGLNVGSPLESTGVTIEHRLNGAKAPPPPLGHRPKRLPSPGPAVLKTAGRAGLKAESVAVAHIVGLSLLDDGGEVASGPELAPIMAVSEVLPDLLADRDALAVNLAASEVAITRLAVMGDETSGITGFYRSRSENGAVLQPSEMLCVAFIQRHMEGVAGVSEIGCGLGVLSMFAARKGLPALAVERNGPRILAAQAISQALGAKGSARLEWARGTFPRVLRRRLGLSSRVALVTNLLGSATVSQQRDFVEGLSAFGAVLIDAQRFYLRRTAPGQIEELISLFRLHGFDPPRLAFDLGADGRFLLFLNPQAQSPKGVRGVMDRFARRFRTRPAICR